jgi:hypothetical protein
MLELEHTGIVAGLAYKEIQALSEFNVHLSDQTEICGINRRECVFNQAHLGSDHPVRLVADRPSPLGRPTVSH